MNKILKWILIFPFFLCIINCKEKEPVLIVKKLTIAMEKELHAFQKSEKSSDSQRETLLETIKEFNHFSQKKLTPKNRFIYFYNEALAQTLLAAHLLLSDFSNQNEEKFDTEKKKEALKAVMQGIECYHECFRMINRSPSLIKEKNLQHLKANSEFLHLLLNEMNQNSQEENSQKTKEEAEKKDKDAGENSKNQKSDSIEESSQNQNKDSKDQNSHSQNQANEENQHQSSSFSEDQRLSEKKLNQLQHRVNEKEDSLSSQSEEKEASSEGEKALASELLQAILEEQQRNESTHTIQTQEGYNHVDKDW